MRIHNEFSISNLDEMREIYQSVGWRKQTNEIIKKVWEASTVTAFATIDGRIVGFGRALSDGVFNAAIYDVVIHCDFQKQGIAKKIVENLLTQLKDVSCVHLISTTGNENFYNKIGFRKIKTGMARYLNPVLSKEYLD
jgi:ribosomal protein S18 acetylase RimI-like enzyme